MCDGLCRHLYSCLLYTSTGGRGRGEDGILLGQETAVLLLLCVGLLLLMAAVTNGAGFSLDGIKGRTVGDGQHGTARFAGKGEIRRTFHRVRFRPRAWRRGKHLPKVQGLVVGCEMRGKRVTALVDGDDIHAMMVAGSGAGKTAYFLYPNLEYCCAAGMSFLTSDTKGDLARNYAGIAKDIYGYDAVSYTHLDVYKRQVY